MQKPVKVLAIVCQMSLSGLECRLMDIIRKLDYQRVTLDVFSYREEPGILDEEITSLGSTVYYNPPLTPQNMFWYVQYFKKFLLEHPEYKIVHAHQDAWCSVFCKGAYLAGVPVRIAHSRTAISKFSCANMVKNLIRLPARRYATHYFAVSGLAGEWLFGKKNMREGKVEIWKNAIDCDKYQYDLERRKQVRKALGIGSERVMIHVGNANPFKNQIFLVEVLKVLRARDENFVLFYIGREDKEIFDNIKSKIAEYSLKPYVRFLGSRDDVPDLLQAADIFCFPSFFEGLPGSVLEAQASGLPCVISAEITKEVCVLPSTVRLELSETASSWADEVEKQMKSERINTLNEMKQAGFDIESLVGKLTKFYIRMGEQR